jgi:hypothetical protein
VQNETNENETDQPDEAAGTQSTGQAAPADGPQEVLIVISKLKKYIRTRSGMNTSDGVIPVLSDHLRKLCEDAIANANREGRKTVMDRDFRVPT